MVPSVDVNLWSVFLAGVLSFIIGMIWYSPALFGNLYIKLSGWTKADMNKAKNKSMVGTFITSLIASVITAYVLAHFVVYTTSSTISDALQLGFWLWLGFNMPLNLGSVLWENKSFKYFLIQAGYYLVTTLAMSIVLVRWQ